MADTLSQFLAPMKGLGWSLVTWGIISSLGILLIVVLGVIGIIIYKRKKWNLRVEIKMPRSDGKIIMSEKAKGHYSISEGIVDIKRKGLKTVGMPPFDVRKYLQGINYLEVLQIGPSEFIPVLPKSYTVITNEKAKEGENKRFALLDIEADLDKRKTWRTYFERAAKGRFTLTGFLEKHWRSIELGIIVFIIFLGFAILWIRMPSICGA